LKSIIHWNDEKRNKNNFLSQFHPFFV